MMPYFVCPYKQNCMMGMNPYEQNVQSPYPMPFDNEMSQMPMQWMPMIPGMDDTDVMHATVDMNDMNMSPKISNRDPLPILSNNPPTSTISLFKELTGYPNYGNPSGNADILYTRNRGEWTFDVPRQFSNLQDYRTRLLIRMSLDDHYNTPVNKYSANISINGATVHTGVLPLAHGVPAGGKFTNWKTLTFNIRNLKRNNKIVILNTSKTNPDDWIGIDYMEILSSSK